MDASLWTELWSRTQEGAEPKQRTAEREKVAALLGQPDSREKQTTLESWTSSGFLHILFPDMDRQARRRYDVLVSELRRIGPTLQSDGT